MKTQRSEEIPLLILSLSKVLKCVNDCSGQGTCSAASGTPMCLCYSGWQPPDCASAYVIPTSAPSSTTFDTAAPNRTSDSQQLLSRTSAPATKKSGMSKQFKLGLSIGLAGLVIALLIVGVLIWRFHGKLITMFGSSSEGARKLSVSARRNSDLWNTLITGVITHSLLCKNI
jgi:hypothetical protein